MAAGTPSIIQRARPKNCPFSSRKARDDEPLVMKWDEDEKK
ncbi:MAG: hypothetical protein ABI874_12205 [Chloroflexota bacterium]